MCWGKAAHRSLTAAFSSPWASPSFPPPFKLEALRCCGSVLWDGRMHCLCLAQLQLWLGLVCQQPALGAEAEREGLALVYLHIFLF